VTYGGYPLILLYSLFVGGQGRGARGSRGECTERWCCATATASASASAASEPSSASKQHAKVCTEHSALTLSSCLPFLLLLRSYIHALLSLIPCPPNPTAPPPSSHNRENMDTIICHRTFRQSSSSLSVYRAFIPPLLPSSSHPPSLPSPLTHSLTPPPLSPTSPLSPHLTFHLPPPSVSLSTMGRTYITWGTPRWFPLPCSSSTSTTSPTPYSI